MTTTYAYDASQQITGLTRRVAGITTGSLSFDHDNAGRLTAITGAEGSRSLTYDAQGHLAGIVDVRGPVQATTERTTDGDGALLSSITTGTLSPRSTSFRWDPHDPLRQIVTVTESGNTANLVYGMGRALAIRGGSAAVFAQDPHGSTLAIGPAADLARAGGYDEYGVPSGSTTPTLLDEVTGDATGAGSDHQVLFGYRGEAHLSGMVDLRARSYVPALGSFTSVDPLPGVVGEVTAANTYHYANNDPLNGIDPLGLRPTDDDFVDRPCASYYGPNKLELMADGSPFHGRRSTAAEFSVPAHPGYSCMVINMFIPQDHDGIFGIEGRGDDRGFDPYAPASASRAHIEIDMETGRGLITASPSCYWPASSYGDCRNARDWSTGQWAGRALDDDNGLEVEELENGGFRLRVVAKDSLSQLAPGISACFSFRFPDKGNPEFVAEYDGYPAYEAYQLGYDGNVENVLLQDSPSRWGLLALLRPYCS